MNDLVYMREGWGRWGHDRWEGGRALGISKRALRNGFVILDFEFWICLDDMDGCIFFMYYCLYVVRKMRMYY